MADKKPTDYEALRKWAAENGRDPSDPATAEEFRKAQPRTPAQRVYPNLATIGVRG